MKLSTLSLVLGAGLAAQSLHALLKPKQFIGAARKFPRSLPWGYALMTVGTLGFLHFLKQESIADFESYKPMMMAIFGAVAVAVCIFVSDFLAVRGLAISFLVLAKLMTDTARPHLDDSHWVLVIQLWAYALVCAGIWFTVSPWRCRDLIHWGTASESRLKLLSGIRLAFAALLVLLGLTVF
ncbi:MAG: hypothetical protein HY301_20135 [Verrucomicrobia bacterium]|nr:hypothetical protein [Verrucomicrobiota bacterium]